MEMQGQRCSCISFTNGVGADINVRQKIILCPVCGNKTRNGMRENTK